MVTAGLADCRSRGLRLAHWYGQLKSALDYIHAAGIVHRDVKPSNILINADGDAVLGDFGISRFTDGELRRKLDAETTMDSVDADARTVMGSVMYLAPEARRGEKATLASDAYALGVTFYRLLTGIWYEPGPVADGLLSEFGRRWSRALKRLLSAEPAARLPIPSVETGNGSAKKRWYIVAISTSILALIGAVWLWLVGTASRAVRGGRGATALPAKTQPATALPKYTFDQFFPRHTEQPPK